MFAAYQDDLLDSPGPEPLDLMDEKGLSADREQRLFPEGPEPLGLPGEEEKGFDGSIIGLGWGLG